MPKSALNFIVPDINLSNSLVNYNQKKGESMIPWKLITEFDQEKHLFSNIVDTNYFVNSFICSCGHVDILVRYIHEKLDYTCPLCGNRTFHDANSAWRNIDYFLSYNKDIELSYSYDIVICKESIEARYITMIPKSIDFMRQKVLFSRKKLASLHITDKGNIEESFKIEVNGDVSNKLKKILIIRLNKKSNHFNLPMSEHEPLDIDSAHFFLRNKHLKNFDFYRWMDIDSLPTIEMTLEKALKIISNHRKEKSVRKTIYNNYCLQKRESDVIHTSLIEAFTKEIGDPNILVQLLQLNIYDSYFYKDDSIKFLQILKRRFAEKQILALFIELSKDNSLRIYFKDMKRTITQIEDIDDFFKTNVKLKCTVLKLHNAATGYERNHLQKKLANKKIYNTKHKLKPCVQIDNYKIRLPQNGTELYDWANTLHNCMAGYYKMIANNETLIYGFFANDSIEFAVEISEE